jgi:acetoacetate decarboxylase
MINYPSAPWYLQGYAIQTLQLVDTHQSRYCVPPELEIVSILPGKTLGSIYVSQYETGSIFEYNELIVVLAIVVSVVFFQTRINLCVAL